MIIRSLRLTLEDYGISGIIELSNGKLRVCPEKFSCDLYRYEGKSYANVYDTCDFSAAERTMTVRLPRAVSFETLVCITGCFPFYVRWYMNPLVVSAQGYSPIYSPWNSWVLPSRYW